MAERRIKIEFCAPTHTPVSVDADEVIVPGAAGMFTVLPGHTPLLTSLGIGVLTAYESPVNARRFAIHGGFAEVIDDHVTILADTMELAENIDTPRAEAATERAKERLRKRAETTDIARAEVALARSIARMSAVSGNDL